MEIAATNAHTGIRTNKHARWAYWLHETIINIELCQLLMNSPKFWHEYRTWYGQQLYVFCGK